VKTSLVEIFKVGIGPSSSHTVGPMRAAAEFAGSLDASVERVMVELFGSLALTGRGHGTDRAVVAGLNGELPDRVEPGAIEGIVKAVREAGRLRLNGAREIGFVEERDLVFHMDCALPGHSNGMRFTGLARDGREVTRQVYYSIGGGFIAREGEMAGTAGRTEAPHPFASADELLRRGDEAGLAIWEVALANETSWHGEAAVRAFVAHLAGDARMCGARAGY
jgi:L-serine dehydratase